MKKILITLYSIFLPLYASADQGFYLSGDGGANWTSHKRVDFNVGYVYAGQMGYKILDTNLRIEVEASFRKNTLYKYHISSTDAKTIGLDFTGVEAHGFQRTITSMVHLLYDMDLAAYCFVEPYIGAGIGFSRERLNVHNLLLPPTSPYNTDAANAAIKANQKFDFRKHGVSWDFLIGFRYELTANFDFDFHYHYLRCKNSHNNDIEAGLKYNF